VEPLQKGCSDTSLIITSFAGLSREEKMVHSSRVKLLQREGTQEIRQILYTSVGVNKCSQCISRGSDLNKTS